MLVGRLGFPQSSYLASNELCILHARLMSLPFILFCGRTDRYYKKKRRRPAWRAEFSVQASIDSERRATQTTTTKTATTTVWYN